MTQPQSDNSYERKSAIATSLDSFTTIELDQLRILLSKLTEESLFFKNNLVDQAQVFDIKNGVKAQLKIRKNGMMNKG